MNIGVNEAPEESTGTISSAVEPFKTYDRSHLCSNDLCHLHLDYEGSNKNQDRKDCGKHAGLLRAKGLPVLKGCGKHDPPCMLQVLVLFLPYLLLADCFIILRLPS